MLLAEIHASGKMFHMSTTRLPKKCLHKSNRKSFLKNLYLWPPVFTLLDKTKKFDRFKAT